MLAEAGCDLLWLPTPAQLYPPGFATTVSVAGISERWDGAARPGHFDGVATVVAKLLLAVRPDIAVFGEKDYQQLAVIRRMVRDLFLPVEIVGVPTVREADGLAMSSRNARLSPEAREAAKVLSRALGRAEAMVRDGRTVEEMTAAIRETMTQEPRATLMGLDVVDAEKFTPVVRHLTRRAGIMISAEVDGVLLIDQREVSPPVEIR